MNEDTVLIGTFALFGVLAFVLSFAAARHEVGPDRRDDSGDPLSRRILLPGVAKREWYSPPGWRLYILSRVSLALAVVVPLLLSFMF